MDGLKTLVEVPIDKLRFDPQNPRLLTSVDSRDESAILTWMLQDATLIELMGSIGEHGYFSGEPLLVVPALSVDGTYTVIEGNRRLAAVKLLLHPEIAPARKQSVKAASTAAKKHPATVPVLVYDKRDDILDYLGYRHVTGIAEWGPLEKAKYLKQLRDLHRASTSQELARTIGSRADYVERLLTGLAVYEEVAKANFYGISGLNEARIQFSLLTTALSYSNIVHFLGLGSARDATLAGLDSTRLEELIRWLFDKPDGKKSLLGESRNLEQLSAVVASDDGLHAFREGATLEAAANIAEGVYATLTANLMQARSQLEMAWDTFMRSKAASQRDRELLGEIRGLVHRLLDEVADLRDTSTSTSN